MSLKNVNELPPGGWQYRQKDSAGKVIKENWTNRHSPFSDFCMEVLRVREANKYDRATLPQTKEDVDEFNCQRLGYDPNYVKKKPVSFSPVRLFSPQHLREGVKAVAERVGGLASGSRVLLRWLGDDGQPVSAALSQARSDVCTGRLSGTPCPYNESGFKPIERIAEVIKEQTEAKNNLKITVEGEEKLQTCSLCFCALQLKVHVPFEYIISGMPSPMIDKFRTKKPDCWVVKELDERNKTQK